mgnify:CR=1 FL=1
MFIHIHHTQVDIIITQVGTDMDGVIGRLFEIENMNDITQTIVLILLYKEYALILMYHFPLESL